MRDRLDQALAAVPEHAKPTRNFAAASVPLRPFETPALAKVIERDEFGLQLTLPPERSAPTIEAGGPTAVQTFNAVAPEEARSGFENYLGTKLLDAATDARGTVSGDALALGIRDRSDVLDTVPGLQRRLQGVRAADEALAPQRQGAIGELSRAATTEAAGSMVLPAKPWVGGERELVDLIMRTAREEPQGTAQLVRQRLGDGSRRAYFGRNNAALADILSVPDSVQQIRAIAARRGEPPFADAFMRMAVQAPTAGRTR